MPRATRLGDNCTGHDACPPRPIISASPNVYTNGIAQARIGDAYAAHGCIDHPPHGAVLASGSATVFVNGIAAGRIGDAVSCGGNAAQGSANVFIGG